ncbi:UNKNOWN [Stylonychia lemnae]|uniref:Uncharacterized protein n=1 Tax=Stylonychia lemnae TaxID=5949 RepID=A0A078AQ18_STYLE|nr:UNKNOWN [Stylonychia lemnae]|eukprot:CDW83038.1 UNKNOWN [Stylonychia lemnae]
MKNQSHLQRGRQYFSQNTLILSLDQQKFTIQIGQNFIFKLNAKNDGQCNLNRGNKSLKTFKQNFLKAAKLKRIHQNENSIRQSEDTKQSTKQSSQIINNQHHVTTMSLNKQILFKRKAKPLIEIDDETRMMLNQDQERILDVAKNFKHNEIKDKLQELLDKSQIQSSLDTQIYRHGKEKENLEQQKAKTIQAQAKIRQFYQRQKDNKSFEQFSQKPKEPSVAKMLIAGNEAYVGDMIEGIRKKIGFYNRKQQNMSNLINLCINKQSHSKSFTDLKQSRQDNTSPPINKHYANLGFTQDDSFQLNDDSSKVSPTKKDSTLAYEQIEKVVDRVNLTFEKRQQQVQNLQEIMRKKVEIRPNQDLMKMQQLLNTLNQIETEQERQMQKPPINILEDSQQNSILQKDFFQSLAKDKKTWEVLIKDDDFEELVQDMSSHYGYHPEIINEDNLYEKSRKYGYFMRKKKQQQNAIHNLEHGNADLNDNKTQIGVKDLMKDTRMVERYSRYLNRCLFMNKDPFMKKKHQSYLLRNQPKQGENFFERMDRDQIVREFRKQSLIQPQESSSKSKDEMARRSRVQSSRIQTRNDAAKMTFNSLNESRKKQRHTLKVESLINKNLFMKIFEVPSQKNDNNEDLNNSL